MYDAHRLQKNLLQTDHLAADGSSTAAKIQILTRNSRPHKTVWHDSDINERCGSVAAENCGISGPTMANLAHFCTTSIPVLLSGQQPVHCTFTDERGGRGVEQSRLSIVKLGHSQPVLQFSLYTCYILRGRSQQASMSIPVCAAW